MVNKSLNAILSKFEVFLIFFIILQPVIDLITSFSILVLDINLTLGIITRFAVMMIILMYILLVPNCKDKIKILTYLILFGVVLIIGLINNLIIKDPISLFSELRNLAKISYVPIVLFGYLLAISRLKERIDIKNKIQKNIYVSMIIVSLVMILASITNTGIKSYDSIKLGHQGWFFAGNEIGAIMAISFAVVLYYAVQNTDSWKKTYYWVPVCLLIFSQLVVGTKVGYASALIVLVISLITFLLEKFRYRDNARITKKYNVNLIINSGILAVFLLLTPFTPVAHNINIHLSWVGLDQEDINHESNDTSTGESNTTEQRESEKDQAVQNILLSGREHFLAQHKEFYAEAPLSQKLFGMGYEGNYKDEGKTVEMDFYDIFFSLGILGFVLYLTPFVYFALKVILSIIRGYKKKLNSEFVLFGSAIMLGLGIAYTAGHVLTAPAVSIYLVVSIAYVYVSVVNINSSAFEQ
ncbi:O-antigen ligase family protein [Bacillus sp. FJAT-47783]|uniref:O-antigen ligase family protein n=1 Tax=Bacillus sp. FJAT-47783 TaxID=2922712 RepID=UPI001FAE2924|nr:O-antigen ligase family protein [Bacillus sp. FJAT-47783]